MITTEFDRFFLNNSEEGIQNFQHTLFETQRLLTNFYKKSTHSYNGKLPSDIKKEIKDLPLVSDKGDAPFRVLEDVFQTVVTNSIHVSHPTSMAHLHCPPLISAIAAELIIATLNQSMDSWDQSSAATYLEEELVGWLRQKIGYSPEADGTFTSGGTQSNYMGLLLARDHFCSKHWNWDVKIQGLPPEIHKLRILCSEAAHFTVKKSASQLGLGEQAVVTISTDKQKKMDVQSLKNEIDRLKAEGFIPMCVVATFGTTDFGSLDPIHEIASVANKSDLWLHVDAAYGGALILSKKHQGTLKGIEKADSITIDFHKLFYQPISCGAFFVKNKECFRYLTYHSDYLNPQNDEGEGLVHLVTKSVQTTRRFDALKLYMSLRMVGEQNFSNMIDYTIQLAAETVQVMEQKGYIEVCNREPEINAVVFRYRKGNMEPLNELNTFIYKRLIHTGTALVAKTKVKNNVFLKLTLLNPKTTIVDIEDIITKLSQFAHEYESRMVTQ
jgi:L-2,4-diaminobutyrate decarboxylase